MKGGLHEQVKNVQAFTPLSRSAATTLYNLDQAIGDAVGIDTKGYDEALIVVNCGVLGLTSLAVNVGFADVDDAEDASFGLLASSTISILGADNGKDFILRVRTKDNKRYMFVKTVQVGAVASVYQISALLGDADTEPVSQAQTVVVPADVG